MGTPEHFAAYHLGLTWSEAAMLLSRLLNYGSSLDQAERDRLFAAAEACQQVRRELAASPELPMGRTLMRVAQPLYPKASLVEALAQAEPALRALGRSGHGQERLALPPGRLPWLFEFLSDCCNLLLRDIATQSLPQAVSKGA